MPPVQGSAPGEHVAPAGSPDASASVLTLGPGKSIGSADAPGDAATSGTHSGPPGLAGFVVGDSVQFFDKHLKKWRAAMVTKKFPNGSVQISGRSAALSAAECKTRLRRPKALTSSRDSAVQDRKGRAGIHRERHVFDDRWTKVAHRWLASLKNVSGVFAKFEETYADKAALQNLKSVMLQLLPKPDFADYAGFYAAPGSPQVRGHVHPCLGGSSTAPPQVRMALCICVCAFVCLDSLANLHTYRPRARHA